MIKQGIVSVIIPAYNSEKWIRQCIESVLAQTYPRWEMMIVCSPSQDGTVDIVKQYLSDTRIALFIEQIKSSQAIGRNIGFKSTSGEFVAFLDADDWWEPDRLEKMIGALQQSPKTKKPRWCADYTAVEFPDETVFRRSYPGPKSDILGVGNIVFRRELLDQIIALRGTVYDENLAHVEDGDLSMVIRKEPSCVVAEFLYHYRINNEGVTSKTMPIEREMDVLRVLMKHHAWGLMPGHLKNLAICFFNRITGCDVISLKNSVALRFAKR